MGPIERAQIERIRAAKSVLFHSGDLAVKEDQPQIAAPRRAPRIVHDSDASWAKAMRPSSRPHYRTMASISKEVCRYFKISRRELHSARRNRTIARARQIGMYLCREFTHQSLPQIGNHFGGRDHTTVLHGIAKIGELMGTDKEIYRSVNDLRERIESF